VQVAAFDPTKLLQSFRKASKAGLAIGIVLTDMHEHADAPHSFGLLLRARHDRPRCRR